MTAELPQNETQPLALELKDLTVADLIRAVRRLKVSAFAVCLGTVASVICAAIGYAREARHPLEADSKEHSRNNPGWAWYRRRGLGVAAGNLKISTG